MKNYYFNNDFAKDSARLGSALKAYNLKLNNHSGDDDGNDLKTGKREEEEFV